jgi:hypothetical protein
MIPTTDEESLRRALLRGTGVVVLPRGITGISSEQVIPPGAHDLEHRGDAAGSTLRASAPFRGQAVIRCDSGRGIRLRNFSIDGNRNDLGIRMELPPYDVPFFRFTQGNGILADRVIGLDISGIGLRSISGFAVLASRSSRVTLRELDVRDSGSLNQRGHNNATGGVLLEEGTTGFRVTGCDLINVRGNGVWTHSLYTSPRNADGEISENRFRTIGRDAIQVGHATNVRVERNAGSHIGYPDSGIDTEVRAIPVAIDTAGNTDRCLYAGNRFEEINGKCIDLDGFHHGTVRDNSCQNYRRPEAYPHGNYGIVMNNSNPDMQSEGVNIVDNTIDGTLFGGIFVIGSHNVVSRNRLVNLNTAHCNENAARFGCYYAPGQPEMLTSGIYLGSGAERPAPARRNTVRDNSISGFKMRTRCIAAAPGVSPAENLIERNFCADGP